MRKLLTTVLSIAMVLTLSAQTFAADEPDQDVSADKPAAVQTFKITKYSYDSLKLTWQTAVGADKYLIYRSVSGKKGSFKLKEATSGTAFTDTGLKCGKTYYYKIRTISTNGKCSYSPVKSSKAQPGKVKTTKIVIPYYEYGKAKHITEHYGSTEVERYVWDVSEKNAYKGFKISWNKVAGATGYQIYMREKNKGAFKFKGNFKGTSGKVSFNDEKQYDIKVRAYRVTGGKKVYGYFSNADSYKFRWSANDLKFRAKKIIEESGYEYNETYVSNELGYDVTEPATMENCGWSGPHHINYYLSLEYVETFWLYSDLKTVIDEHDTDAYCLYISEKATQYGAHQKEGKRGKTLPLYCEVYFLSNGSAYHE